MKKLGNLIIAAILGSAITLGVNFFLQNKTHTISKVESKELPALSTSSTKNFMTSNAVDFSQAAEKSIHAVVHIKSASVVNHLVYGYRKSYDPLAELFGLGGEQYSREPLNKQELKIASGSGVIISPDGFIVTNNHVIEDADELEVVTNDNKTFKAKVVGTDPSTDLAVLKIDAQNLPYLVFDNSDDINIGDWVLAVGNPFNLSSTVTAGIVSAKARNINILKERTAIESFIQTDAAVNPGNSGGALVNLSGSLIGINSAIASPTGSFTGYSFAIPSNIVSKVTKDLIQYGVVQRAFLGVQLAELNTETAQKLGIERTQGVFIVNVMPNGAANDANLLPNDVIVKVNDKEIKSQSELLEQLSQFKPGDHINLEILRNNKLKNVPVVLKNREGTTEVVKNDAEYIFKKLGIKIKELSSEEKAKYSINSGIQVEHIDKGIIKQKTKMQESFIILKANNKTVKTKKQLMSILHNTESSVLLEGFYPGYYGKYFYAVSIK